MFQKHIILGNVGRDPELRFTGSGMAVCTISVAVNKSRRVNEEWINETTWYRVTTWGEQAERNNQKIRKGMAVLVEGTNLEANAYLDKDGNAKASLELTATLVRVVTKGNSEGEENTSAPEGFEPPINPEEVPF